MLVSVLLLMQHVIMCYCLILESALILGVRDRALILHDLYKIKKRNIMKRVRERGEREREAANSKINYLILALLLQASRTHTHRVLFFNITQLMGGYKCFVLFFILSIYFECF